jgi:cysteine synthase A
MALLEDVTGAFGRTPLVRLRRVTQGCGAEIYAKLEFMNPLASVKDRIGVSMVEAAAAQGRLHAETLLVEPTSGNTGVALAFVAAAKGLRLKLVMPDSYSVERRALFRALGAELELTPGRLGMQGAVERARALVEAHPDALMLQQFENPANPAVHERTTAEEIWADTGGQIDGLVTGVGTGGTITGVSRVLKARIGGFRVFAVEPDRCAVISGGGRRGRTTSRGSARVLFPRTWTGACWTGWCGSRTRRRMRWRGGWRGRRGCWWGSRRGPTSRRR